MKVKINKNRLEAYKHTYKMVSLKGMNSDQGYEYHEQGSNSSLT